jgi:hypothetical protein
VIEAFDTNTTAIAQILLHDLKSGGEAISMRFVFCINQILESNSNHLPHLRKKYKNRLHPTNDVENNAYELIERLLEGKQIKASLALEIISENCKLIRIKKKMTPVHIRKRIPTVAEVISKRLQYKQSIASENMTLYTLIETRVTKAIEQFAHTSGVLGKIRVFIPAFVTIILLNLMIRLRNSIYKALAAGTEAKKGFENSNDHQEGMKAANNGDKSINRKS